MPPSPPTSTATLQNARATHTVKAKDIVGVLSHRKFNGLEEYLVRWNTTAAITTPSYAPCSWHTLGELWDALQHVQTYVDTRPRGRGGTDKNSLSANRKRKSPGGDPSSPRDGMLNGYYSDRSRSSSAFVVDSVMENIREDEKRRPRVYNAVLWKKAGSLVVKQPNPQLHDGEVATIDAATLPTVEMIETASKTPVKQAERAIRIRFLEMLQPVKRVNLENEVDDTTPSLNFTFIPDYVYGKGVIRPSEDSYIGCDKCRPDMGQGIGCEYTAKCDCLEYAAVDEQRLARTNPELDRKYHAAKKNGDYPPDGLPKRFPYSAPSKDDPRKPQRLVQYYLNQRHPIYECNPKCRCGPRCKSRLVQKGRQVPLTIFKTLDRGWGVKCDEALMKGEFIDTYVGEVITNEEATRRERETGQEKDSYLYSLNKFVESDVVGYVGIDDDNCYVVDGQLMGGITRFINHSCEPNCRQYTVSYDKNNYWLYKLAFFAWEDIPAGTELTFDYQDLDEEEEEEAIRKREEALRDPANKGKVRCNCGTKGCRGFLW